MDEKLQHFLENLIKQAHQGYLSEPLLKKMTADLTIQLDQRLHEAILLALPPADQAAYQDKIFKAISATELQAWLQSRISDLPQLTEYICRQFAQEYIAVCTQ